MKILVTGVSGLLGHDVWQLFGAKHDLIALGRQRATWVSPDQFRECDLTNAALTYAIITKENPDLVVHCAAFNLVDVAEADPEAAYRGNSLATRNIALACQRFATTLISVSTDYVFDGCDAPTSGYREFDATQPISIYGRSKLWAEQFVQQLIPNHFIVRTSWLFGPGRGTWVDKVRELALNGEPIAAASDMVSAPTFTPDLAAALLRLAESRHYGVYHLTNAGFCTRVALAEEVLKLSRVSDKGLIKRVKVSDLKLAAARPAFSGLDNLAWRLDGFPPLRSWQKALQDHFSRNKVKTS